MVAGWQTRKQTDRQAVKQTEKGDGYIQKIADMQSRRKREGIK